MFSLGERLRGDISVEDEDDDVDSLRLETPDDEDEPIPFKGILEPRKPFALDVNDKNCSFKFN
jgi:hypothetical protein